MLEKTKDNKYVYNEIARSMANDIKSINNNESQVEISIWLEQMFRWNPELPLCGYLQIKTTKNVLITRLHGTASGYYGDCECKIKIKLNLL